ncbi:hypothetical protein V8F33_011978 [Rhypophila sp. PSN 637]
MFDEFLFQVFTSRLLQVPLSISEFPFNSQHHKAVSNISRPPLIFNYSMRYYEHDSENMLNDMMYNTQGKLLSRRQTSCRWSPFHTVKSPERRCLGYGMRISRPRSSERRQGSGRVPRAVMRKHPSRIVIVRGKGRAFSAILRQHYQAWQEQSGRTEQSTPSHSQSTSPLMTLTANEISDLNDLLIKLSLSDPMLGVAYGSVMDEEDIDIQTEPLHDDGQPGEAVTALTSPTPKIPSLTLGSPLMDLPDLNLNVGFESRPEVQNMLLRIMETRNIESGSAPASIPPQDPGSEKMTEKPSEAESNKGASNDAGDEKQLAIVPEKAALGTPSNEASPSYRTILLLHNSPDPNIYALQGNRGSGSSSRHYPTPRAVPFEASPSHNTSIQLKTGTREPYPEARLV